MHSPLTYIVVNLHKAWAVLFIVIGLLATLRWDLFGLLACIAGLVLVHEYIKEIDAELLKSQGELEAWRRGSEDRVQKRSQTRRDTDSAA